MLPAVCIGGKEILKNGYYIHKSIFVCFFCACLLPLQWTALIYMHMRRNMCETTAPSRVKNYSWGTNRFLWGCSASVYSQIFCTQPAICYVVKTDFFFLFCCKGKLIAKRAENLFSYWLGGAECQDGGGQLWGKAGRPAAFCLSHA